MLVYTRRDAEDVILSPMVCRPCDARLHHVRAVCCLISRVAGATGADRRHAGQHRLNHATCDARETEAAARQGARTQPRPSCSLGRPPERRVCEGREGARGHNQLGRRHAGKRTMSARPREALSASSNFSLRDVVGPSAPKKLTFSLESLGSKPQPQPPPERGLACTGKLSFGISSSTKPNDTLRLHALVSDLQARLRAASPRVRR